MKLQFFKYQATGNDFIIFDGRTQEIPLNPDNLSQICDRRFGIGADGVIVISNHPALDFDVKYLNPDGSESLCGNGTRAAIRFAQKLNIFSGTNTTFHAFDGKHNAEILSDGRIKLHMNDVQAVRSIDDGMFIDTGSPHLIRFVENVDEENVFETGRKLRYEAPINGGTNVNFVEILNENSLKIRTYERGVENETLSCGTGVTACALASVSKSLSSPVKLETKGGALEVEFNGNFELGFQNIYLTGPAEEVFEGLIELN